MSGFIEWKDKARRRDAPSDVSRLNKFRKNSSVLLEHTRIPEVQLISRYTWDKLSDEDKAIISECAKESAVYERDIWKNTEEAAVKMIEDKDITVTKVSDEEKQNLREKLQPIYDKYCSNYIDIIKEIEKNQE